MANESDSIPEPRDLAEAREIIATLERNQQELEQRLVYAERKTLLLQHELDVLLRRIFGRRSEKFTADERQLMLAIIALRLRGPSPESWRVPDGTSALRGLNAGAVPRRGVGLDLSMTILALQPRLFSSQGELPYLLERAQALTHVRNHFGLRALLLDPEKLTV